MSTSCSRCGGDAKVTESFKDRGSNIFCTRCWNMRMVNRVRKHLVDIGYSKDELAESEKALIIWDGSSSAIALINLVYNAALNEYNPHAPPFPFTFQIFAVLEDDCFGAEGGGVSLSKLNELVEWMKVRGMEHIGVYGARLKQSLGECPDVSLVSRTTLHDRLKNSDQGQDQHPGQGQDLGKVMQELKSKTAQNDFVRVLRWRLLGRVARHLGIRYIFLPDSQTQLGANMFSLMALGRGIQVANEMAISAIWNGLTICRVLKDVSDVELTQYLSTLEDPILSGLIAHSGKKHVDSLDGQCSDFVGNLQVGYPGTVSTLTGIGGKLAQAVLSSDLSPIIKPCVFCKGNKEGVEGLVHDWCYGCSKILNELENGQLLQRMVVNSL